MSSSPKHRIRWLFLLLALLASGQVFWWAHLLVSQNSEIASLRAGATLQSPIHFRTMVFAEGAFFLCVWTIGMALVYRSYKGQVRLRRLESDFLSAITHELKTPIANIRLCLDTLEREDLSEIQRQKYLRRAQDSCSKLLDEVEAVLTMNQIATLNPQSVPLRELVQSCVSQQNISASEVFIEASDEISIRAPIEQSRLVIQSLLNNAVKYSSKSEIQPRIRVTTERVQRGTVDLVIEDRGIGFNQEELARAFDPFWRSDRGRAFNSSGTGLGLALAKRLSETAGFSLWLSSPGPDLGASARVRFAVDDQKRGVL